MNSLQKQRIKSSETEVKILKILGDFTPAECCGILDGVKFTITIGSWEKGKEERLKNMLVKYKKKLDKTKKKKA